MQPSSDSAMRDIAIFLAIALIVMGVVFFTTSPVPEPPSVDLKIDAPSEVWAGETFTVTVSVNNASLTKVRGDVFVWGSGWRGHNPIQTDGGISLEWEECNTPLGRDGCRVWFQGQVLSGQSTLVTIPIITDHTGGLTIEVILFFDSKDHTAFTDKKIISIK